MSERKLTYVYVNDVFVDAVDESEINAYDVAFAYCEEHNLPYHWSDENSATIRFCREDQHNELQKEQSQ